MSNDLFSLNDQSTHVPGSIFNQLLNHYENPQNSHIILEQKLFAIEEYIDQEQRPQHKSSGQWVWADQDSFQNVYEQEQNDDNKFEPITTDNVELRRVKSLRIEQEDKVIMFLKKDSFAEIEVDNLSEQKQEQQRVFHSPHKKSQIVNKSQSLSPRKCKSKKIDKFKQFRLI